MKVVDSLLNRSEEAVRCELEKIASDNSMRVFSKPRLSDVIDKGGSHLTSREFDFYTRAHCDFVVADADARPIMIVEYDGPFHRLNAEQQERDEIKNELCRRAGLGLLRINDRYVTKLYRGMTVLRWIIEVTEMEKAFYAAQEDGQIPWDEPFDPTFLEPAGSGGRFPYWLGAPATQSFHRFFKTLDHNIPKGFNGVLGHDENGASLRLSCLYFGNQILWTKTGIRKQDLQFPDYDLLSEIDTCDLGILLKSFERVKSPRVHRRISDPFSSSSASDIMRILPIPWGRFHLTLIGISPMDGRRECNLSIDRRQRIDRGQAWAMIGYRGLKYVHHKPVIDLHNDQAVHMC